jgi:5'-phosphate synthase pdxT subunit
MVGVVTRALYPRVGILGYQGCIEPHERIYRGVLGVETVRVRTPEDLKLIDRLILPGGESTTMLHFIKLFGMFEPLKSFASEHRVWGICAGAILAASDVKNPVQDSLGLIDITAHRNFYGSQLDSFTAGISLSGALSQRLDVSAVTAHFIRAPLLNVNPNQGTDSVATKRGAQIETCGYYGKQAVFFEQGLIWACSFHVELGDDLTLHKEFLRNF